jgi:hypothetical protein
MFFPAPEGQQDDMMIIRKAQAYTSLKNDLSIFPILLSSFFPD